MASFAALVAYLDARAAHIQAMNDRKSLSDIVPYVRRRLDAWQALGSNTTSWCPWPVHLAPRPHCDVETPHREEEFVFFPLLVEELGGDREAAAVAWAFGSRPVGYPKGA